MAPNSLILVVSKLPGTTRELKRLKRLRDCKLLLIKRLLQLLISYVRRMKRKRGRLILLVVEQRPRERKLTKRQKSYVYKRRDWLQNSFIKSLRCLGSHRRGLRRY